MWLRYNTAVPPAYIRFNTHNTPWSLNAFNLIWKHHILIVGLHTFILRSRFPCRPPSVKYLQIIKPRLLDFRDDQTKCAHIKFTLFTLIIYMHKIWVLINNNIFWRILHNSMMVCQKVQSHTTLSPQALPFKIAFVIKFGSTNLLFIHGSFCQCDFFLLSPRALFILLTAVFVFWHKQLQYIWSFFIVKLNII